MSEMTVKHANNLFYIDFHYINTSYMLTGIKTGLCIYRSQEILVSTIIILFEICDNLLKTLGYIQNTSIF